MNYKLNFAIMMLVFSVVTYNVCMAYQNLESLNVQGKFKQIGLLEDQTSTAVIIPPKKPAAPIDKLAAL